jgi:hypothetical protein
MTDSVSLWHTRALSVSYRCSVRQSHAPSLDAYFFWSLTRVTQAFGECFSVVTRVPTVYSRNIRGKVKKEAS